MNKINGVSFGCLYTKCERSGLIRSPKQRQIENTVNDIFIKREERNGNYSNAYNKTLAEMIEDDLLQDVQIKHKSNGNVELNLTNFEFEDEIAQLAYDSLHKISEEEKPTLIIDKNLPQREIRKKISNYANRCRELSNFYDRNYLY